MKWKPTKETAETFLSIKFCKLEVVLQDIKGNYSFQ